MPPVINKKKLNLYVIIQLIQLFNYIKLMNNLIIHSQIKVYINIQKMPLFILVIKLDQ